MIELGDRRVHQAKSSIMRTVLLLLLLSSISSAMVAVARGGGRGRGGRGHRSAPSEGRGRGSAPAEARGSRGSSRRGANRDWYSRRAAGDRAATRRGTNRAKRWEREGDALYAEVNSDPSIHFRGMDAAEMHAEASAMLARLHRAGASSSSSAASKDQETDASSTGAAVDDPAVAAPAATPVKSSPAMWGTCSVGPVLKQHLVAAGLDTPLPIQEAAFAPISKGKNVVIGSATGSGKTLAFLLPMLATSSRRTPCTHLVVTASAELARQLQREVDRLWPPLAAADGAAAVSALHVVGAASAGAADGAEAPAMDEAPMTTETADNGAGARDGRAADRSELLGVGEAPVLVGTPHALRRLFAQARDAQADGGAGLAAARLLHSNLKVLVLDEADQLLRSAAVAQGEARRKELVAKQGAPLTARQRAQLKSLSEPSITEMLLEELPVPLARLQLVCASATVGRALRRQLQVRLLGVPRTLPPPRMS